MSRVELKTVLQKEAPGTEVVLIDDGGDVGTAGILEQLAESWPNCRVYHLPENLTEGNGTQNATEGTLGLAWHANKYLKFEQGVTRASDRSWQLVVAWEWSFGGN